MARKDPQVNIRIPEEVKRAIEEEARKTGRTFTAEVVVRLASSLESGSAETLAADIRNLLAERGL